MQISSQTPPLSATKAIANNSLSGADSSQKSTSMDSPTTDPNSRHSSSAKLATISPKELHAALSESNQQRTGAASGNLQDAASSARTIQGLVVASGKLNQQEFKLLPNTANRLSQTQFGKTAEGVLASDVNHWAKIAVTQKHNLLVVMTTAEFNKLSAHLGIQVPSVQVTVNSNGQLQIDFAKLGSVGGSKGGNEANPLRAQGALPQAGAPSPTQPSNKTIADALQQLPKSFDATSKSFDAIAKADVIAKSHGASAQQLGNSHSADNTRMTFSSIDNTAGSPTKVNSSTAIPWATSQLQNAANKMVSTLKSQLTPEHFAAISSKINHYSQTTNSQPAQPANTSTGTSLTSGLNLLQQVLANVPIGLKNQLLPPKVLTQFINTALSISASHASGEWPSKTDSLVQEAKKILGLSYSMANLSALQTTAQLAEKLAGDAVLTALALIFKQLPKSQRDTEDIQQSRQAIAKWLNTEASMQLARTAMNQASNLANAASYLDRSEPLSLQQEMPMKFEQAFGHLHFKIEEKPHRESPKQAQKQSDKIAKSQWAVDLSFELPRGHMLDAKIQLQGEVLNASFWFDDAILAMAANDAVPKFRDAIIGEGLILEGVECHVGRAPKPQTAMQQSMIDVRT